MYACICAVCASFQLPLVFCATRCTAVELISHETIAGEQTKKKWSSKPYNLAVDEDDHNGEKKHTHIKNYMKLLFVRRSCQM